MTILVPTSRPGGALLSDAERMARLPPKDRAEAVRSLTEAQAQDLQYCWRFWARPKQLAPPGDWENWLIRAGRGFGKALALDTPIATPTGWSTMGSLTAGAKVFDETGAVCTVVEAHPVMLGRPCFEVEFSDGAKIVADEQHLWLTINRRARKAERRAVNPQIIPSLVTTQEIAACVYDGKEVNHAIPLAGELELPERELPIDPYLLGCWLGDGASRDAEITTADPEIMHAFVADGWLMVAKSTQNSGRATTWNIRTFRAASVRCGTSGQMVATGEGWLTKIKMLGVWQNKHIPQQYLRASVAQRLALLQGLMDTDGYVGDNHCEYCSVKKPLAEGLLELCTSLGIKAVMLEGRAKLYGRDCGPRYRVNFTAYKPVARLPRKLAAIRPARRQSQRQARRYITAVCPIPSVPVRCITVDSPSSLYLCGRAMIPTHNTRSGAGWVQERAMDHAGRWIALVARNSADARDYMIEGPGGLLKNARPQDRPIFEVSKRRVTWPNGSWATIYTDEDPDQVRGFSGDTAWLDEFAKYKHPTEVWDNLSFGMREASNDTPRKLITTTPRPLALLKAIEKMTGTVVVVGSSYENRANLDPKWFANTLARYANTRIGRQEIEAEILEDVPGALWTRRNLDENRVLVQDVPPLSRLVVAIDPAITSGDSSNETGIIAAGIDAKQRGYVLEDGTLSGTPDQWARRAVSLYRKFEADMIVAEANQGGEMVERVLRSVAPDVPISLVRATRGKYVRAEPVAALYEQGRVSHCGTFADLEDQMISFTPESASVRLPGESPDRVDALVWAFAELFSAMTVPVRVERDDDYRRAMDRSAGGRNVTTGY